MLMEPCRQAANQIQRLKLGQPGQLLQAHVHNRRIAEVPVAGDSSVRPAASGSRPLPACYSGPDRTAVAVAAASATTSRETLYAPGKAASAGVLLAVRRQSSPPGPGPAVVGARPGRNRLLRRERPPGCVRRRGLSR